MAAVIATEELPVRDLQPDDFAKGFLELLAQLTSVGPVTEREFCDRLHAMRTCGLIHVLVIEAAGRIVAVGTLMVEPKFVHGCGACGHIEDVVVDQSCRGKRLGERIIRELKRVAASRGCYKVILDCSESNEGFYAKCGFKRKEIQMRCDMVADAGPGKL